MIHDMKQNWVALTIILTVIIIAVITGISYANQSDQVHPHTDLQTQISTETDFFPDKAYPEMATGFTVEYHNTYKVVRIPDPWGNPQGNQTYLLVQRGESIPSGYPDAQIISIPARQVVPTVILHIPYLSALNETSSIIAYSGIRAVNNETFQDYAKQGKIIEIQGGGQSMRFNVDLEKVIDLEPDVVFRIGTGNSDDNEDIKNQEMGLKVVMNYEWMEKNPLARAEWIKFYSLFFNKEKTANQYFETIKKKYLSLKEKAATVSEKPTIFSGISSQGSWYATSGDGYEANLFRDAGGNYIWGNNTQRGYQWLDFESVYDQAKEADFWINIGMGDDVERILALDSRFQKFNVFANNHMYHYNNRINEYGGNDYWEAGVINPDVVLADIIKILHPELLPDHELYYYKQIRISPAGDSV